MATSKEFIEFVCEQIHGIGDVRHRKMFGEYMVYVDDKPTLLVCDDTVFVKMLPEIEGKLSDTGIPYKGAKLHYILDIDDSQLSKEISRLVADKTPLPKKRNKKR